MDDRIVSHPTLDLIAEHTSDLILIANRNGEVTYISPSVRAYGYEPEEMLGPFRFELIHPDDLQRFIRNSFVVATGEVPPIEQRQTRFRTAAGSWVWLEGNPGLVTDATGQPVAIVNVFRDVTRRRELEAQARERVELFEVAFRDSGIGQILVALDGHLLRANAAFLRMIGYTESDLPGLHFRAITHPDDISSDLRLLERLRAGEIASFERDKRYIRRDGSVVWARVAASVVRDADGSAKHFVAQIQDMSEGRAALTRLEETEARYRLIADNSSDIIMMTDLQGAITYISPSLRQIGYEPAEVVGRRVWDVAQLEGVDAIRELRLSLLAGEEAEGRVRTRLPHGATGEPIWVETRMTLLRDPDNGSPACFLDVLREVTPQVAQEQALAEAHAEAEAAAVAKTQFLANMSHEIRTPLTAVLGFAELLAKRPSLDERAQVYVEKITGAGNALLAIVNDILDFSKLEAGKFEIRPRPTDVAGLCEETLHLFSSQAEAKGLSLTFLPDPGLPHAVMLDSDRVRQLLINLIGNAVKFSEQGGVTLRAGAAAEGHAVRLDVEDTGPGLQPGQVEHLFQRFSQIDGSEARRHGGTGLGLAICKGVTEAMGGEIGVESEPGRRTIFHVILPAEPVDTPTTIEAEREVPSIRGLRVLVVDDNGANRELARQILEAREAEVAEAPSGTEALHQLAGAPFDAMLLDLRMPGLDGRDVMSRLRAEPGPNRDVPVIAFTADMDVNPTSNPAGFSGLVRKPISAVEMVAVIAGASRRAH